MRTTQYPYMQDRLLLTCGLAAALLFWAAFDDHADGFYTFLKIYVCGLSVIWAFAFHAVERPAWALTAVCSAIVFNPVFSINFDEETWKVIDFVAAALFSWIALQQYALMTGRRWAPFAPGALAAVVLMFSQIDLSSPYVGTPTMDVDTIEANSIIMNDSTALDAEATMDYDSSQLSADDALNAAANAIDNAANAIDDSSATYAGDRLRMRPNELSPYSDRDISSIFGSQNSAANGEQSNNGTGVESSASQSPDDSDSNAVIANDASALDAGGER